MDNTSKSPARMRYPAEAYEQLHRDDPDSCVSLNLIRELVRRGDIPSMKVGRGRMLNYDRLIEYLSSVGETASSHPVQGIRRIG